MSNEREIPRIESSEPVRVKHLDFPIVEPFNPVNQEKVEETEAGRLPIEIELNTFEKTKLAILVIWNLITSIIKLRGLQMSENTEKKTTLLATVKVIIRLIAVILGFFAVTIPESIELTIPIVVVGIAEIFSWLQGFFSKDKEK